VKLKVYRPWLRDSLGWERRWGKEKHISSPRRLSLTLPQRHTHGVSGKPHPWTGALLSLVESQIPSVGSLGLSPFESPGRVGGKK